MASPDSALPSVMVTGASGFVGSSLMKRLRRDGAEVRGIGRRRLPDADYHSWDLAEPLELDFKPDVVVHAAALSAPWGSREAFERSNVRATENVIEFCRRCGARLVFISSSSVYYENAHQFDLTEESPWPERPINDYAATKRIAEARVRAHDGDWVILRPRAVFGPGDTVVFPRILTAARAGRLPLLTTEGEAVLGDLIYIENLVDIMVRAATDRAVSGVYNLTNGEPVPILDFLLEVFDRLEIPRPARRLPVGSAMRVAGVLEAFHRVFLPGREPAITRFGVSVFAYSKTFDVSRMRSMFGEPAIGVGEGVDRFVRWVKEANPY